MRLRRLQTAQDIRTCVDMYIAKNDEAFLPSSRSAAYSALATHLKLNDFIRILEDDTGIRAWALFKQVRVAYMSEDALQQLYFASDLEGFKAVRAIRILHDAAVEEAERLGLAYVNSQGSHLDEANIFARILEKHGWTRRGHTAVYKLKHTTRGRPRTLFDRN